MMQEATRRSVLAAVLLSLVCPGLGHIYCGRATRGVTLFLCSLLFAPIALGLSTLGSSVATFAALVASALSVIGVMIFAVVDAGRTALGQGARFTPGELNRAWLYVLFAVLGATYPVGSQLVVRTTGFQAFLVPMASMSPTILPGDRVIVNRMEYDLRAPRRGDVVAFRNPTNRSEVYLKRVIGLPGDVVRVDGNRVTLNGTPLSLTPVSPASLGSTQEAVGEEAVSREAIDGRGHRILIGPGESRLAHHPAVVVPDGSCFCLGDNRDRSRDSRDFGFVPLGDILGPARYVFWPLDRWRLLDERR